MSVSEDHTVAVRRRIARALKESVESVCAPMVAREILHNASLSAGPLLPVDSEELERFVELHLSTAVQSKLGADSAVFVVAQLAPLVRFLRDVKSEPAEIATAKVRRPPSVAPFLSEPVTRRPSDNGAAMSEGSVAATVNVVVATLSEDRVAAIRDSLDGVAEVYHACDVVELLDGLRLSPSPIVVVDCVETSVHVTTLATIAPELSLVDVVMWGGEAEDEIDDASQSKWVRCSEEASARDVASIVTVLVS